MPRFAANLTMLFTEVPFLDRFAAAAEAGFRGVEFLFPYGFEKQRLVDTAAVHGLQVVLHNLPAGDWEAGERGIACHPGRMAEFRAGVARAILYASALRCPRVNCLAGIAPPGDDAARRTLVDNLRFAASALQDAGIELLLEPVNTRDVPGFFVSRTAQALAIMDEVGSDNLKLQFDIYHTQVMEGNLTPTIEAQLGRIGHTQVADNPGRHEPGTGEINYPYLFRRLDQLGYAGWIGCEYKPGAATGAGLDWLDPYRHETREFSPS
nr:2-oxo-tetronate isomerase [uncultured Lichenicoccus sp.]